MLATGGDLLARFANDVILTFNGAGNLVQDADTLALEGDLSAAIESESPIFNLPVYAILPLLILFNGTLLWLLGTGDVAHIGEWIRTQSGIDLFAAREATSHWTQWLGGALSAALLNALGGTVAGHELTHRTSRPFDLMLGRWLLTFTADTSFAIEHVYGHHARVATPDDPATAREPAADLADELAHPAFGFQPLRPFSPSRDRTFDESLRPSEITEARGRGVDRTGRSRGLGQAPVRPDRGRTHGRGHHLPR